MRRLAVAFVVGSSGCAVARNTEAVTIDGLGLSLVSAVIEVGDLAYTGIPRDQFDITATTWGRGSNKEAAVARESTVQWSAVVDGYALLLDGVSVDVRSGVDFDVTGPAFMSIAADVLNGSVYLGDVEGYHSIVASSVSGTVLGDFEVFADGTVDLAFIPYEFTNTLIDASGSVILALPYGLQYDLTIRTSPDQPISVEDLGWQDLVLGEGFVNGYTGFGDVEIDVNTAGPVQIIAL